MTLCREIRNIAAGLLLVVPLSLLTVLAYTVSSMKSAVVPPSLDVIIDCDPGADDAMAILLLLSKLSTANLLAITVVSGNADVENGTKNALLTLQVANRLDIPVYEGSEGLVFKTKSDKFFGNDGFGDSFTRKPPITLKGNDHAAEALVKYVKERPGQITIICTGPLSNIALAQHLYPKFFNNVKDIVILGGSYQGEGNVKPGVEFNIFADAEAASYIFSNVPPGKLPTVIPIEAVNTAETSMDWRINLLGKTNSCFIDFINRAESIALTKSKTWKPFDQLAAAVVLKEEIINSTKTAYIIVETCGEHGRGAIFKDETIATKNVKLITKFNKTLFKELLLTYMSSVTEGCLDVKSLS